MVAGKWIALIVYICCAWFIIVPLFCWWTYQFYKQKDRISINKRIPSLSLMYCVFSILMRVIERPLYIFVCTYSDHDVADMIHSESSFHKEPIGIRILHYLAPITYSLFVVPIMWILFLRYWTIYFNVCWTRSTLNKNWKIHINPSDIEKDWYLSHKQTWGNYKYNLKAFVIVYAIMAIVNLICFYFILSTGRRLGTVISTVLIIVPIVSIFILGYKIRRFNDKFHVIREFNAISIYVAVSISTYLIVGGLLPAIFGFNRYTRNMSVALYSTVFGIIAMYLQTVWVLRMVFLDETLLPDVHVPTTKRIELSTSGSNSNITEKSRSNTIAKQPIANSLTDINNFELFMNHLAKEWSMELLLSVVEISQMQNAIKMEYSESADPEDMKFTALQDALLQNDQIPMSYIVHHEAIHDIINEYNIKLTKEFDAEDKMIQFKIRICALYNKYIDGDELGINISHQQRERLRSFLGNIDYFVQNVNMNPKELFSLYREDIVELERMLHSSYYRFSLD